MCTACENLVDPKQIKLDEVIVKYQSENGPLIPILQEAQEVYGYLPADVLKHISKATRIPLAKIYGVVTFYSQFRLAPVGRNLINVCLGTACHVRGGTRIVDALADELGIKPGQTTPDKKFSLEAVNCLGCCAIGPIILMDGVYHGEMSPQKAIKLVKTLATEKKDDKVKVSKRAGKVTSQLG